MAVVIMPFVPIGGGLVWRLCHVFPDSGANVIWHAPPVIYHINADDVIEDVNDAWVQFAIENDAPSLATEVIGRPLWNYIAGADVCKFFAFVFKQVRHQQSRISLPFRCDSPALYRAMRLHIAPMGEGRIEFCSVLETIRAHPHSLELLKPAAVVSPVSLPMCSWCKAILVAGEWKPLEVALPELSLLGHEKTPTFTHALCDSCRAEFLRDYVSDDPELTADIAALMDFVKRWFKY